MSAPATPVMSSLHFADLYDRVSLLSKALHCFQATSVCSPLFLLGLPDVDLVRAILPAVVSLARLVEDAPALLWHAVREQALRCVGQQSSPVVALHQQKKTVLLLEACFPLPALTACFLSHPKMGE